MQIKTIFLLILITLFFAIAHSPADEFFPKDNWKDLPNPLASPNAKVGGEISIFAGQYSKSLNYYLDNNFISYEVFTSMYDTLLTLSPITAEYEPMLAERWSISNDRTTFTFWLDKRAKWSDGEPITAYDVQWTFQAIMDPKNLTGASKVALEKFLPPEVIDERTIKFKTKEVHWRNLLALGGFNILPKHIFENKDFNKINFEFPVVSGLYKLGEIKEGLFIKLERRDDWWACSEKRFQNTANFQTIIFKFFEERENAFEAFKKGLIDIYPVYTSRLWVNETKGEKLEKNWILKQKIYNYEPAPFQGFAMNMRRPPFDDIKVRKAMAYLLNREKMNRTLMYNQYAMHYSYFKDLYSKEEPCKNEVFNFDKEKARALLKEAGWQVNPQTGFLEKNGKRFSFKFLNRDSSTEKFINIYAEDLKDVGIELKIDKKDLATWIKDMDEFNFDMTWAAWGSVIFKDPESMWASKEADRNSGNNYTGFKDAKVDALIEKQKTIFDVNQRHGICRDIDKIITSQCPYILLWGIDYVRLLYWNKFGVPATVLSKYGNETSAYWYWWYDKDSAEDLTDAIKKGRYLPGCKASVFFDEEFKK
ncbi:MAG: extracellular solute-binding protein [Candidatus Omnitrophica bacterium]|nr:extracellular solute-binding protein [Candidatus Omnitrophota bacterium]MBU1047008.1 extracellular solute-binding protein [Candidatus Omnitrophota bacterium]MBU1630449.1 extracellular solute-binding protein [Candidatus Omnitrophota bacterium]MBU1889554.1 extracellular solute-binding protein [Candidatus Omnitrophota bacterium]